MWRERELNTFQNEQQWQDLRIMNGVLFKLHRNSEVKFKYFHCENEVVFGPDHFTSCIFQIETRLP